MRQIARDCLARAKRLLEIGDEASVRYACFELRLCIEYVTFDQLMVYLVEVADDALKKWTPKQIIDSLREVDPNADASVSIAVGIEDTPGVPAKEVTLLGEDRRFSLKWANTNHNALGNFLHAPTIEQIETRRTPGLATMVEKAKQIADTLGAILSSPVFGVNFGQFFEFDCEDCETKIKRREGSFTAEQGIVCPKGDCRATYDVRSVDAGLVKLGLRQTPYRCPGCQQVGVIGKHRVRDGAVTKCSACGVAVRIEQRLVAVVGGGSENEA